MSGANLRMIAKHWFVAVGVALSILIPRADAQLLVNKSFTPANVPPTNVSTLTIQVQNNSSLPANSLNVTDNLPTSPAGLSIAPAGLLSNSCGGSVAANPGTTTISLIGGSVPAATGGVAGSCLIEIAVSALPGSLPASYLNTIPPANVTSSIGSPSASASATLTVSAPQAITGVKSFTPSNVHGNGPVNRMRIQLNNANSFPLTGTAFTDTFPTQIQLATTPNGTNSCGGTLTAASLGLTLSLSNGTIPATSNCVIEADVVARDSNTIAVDSTVTNSIAANGVTTRQQARNAAAISGAIRVQKGASVTKVFAPAAIVAGGSSVLTITLRNFNATAISGFTFSDAMPPGVTVVGPASTTCTGGTASFTATSLSVAGATLAAAPAGIGSTLCTVTAPVTAPANGTFTNSVPAGNLAGIAYSATSAVLQVSPIAVSKAFSPATMPRSGVTSLIITLINRSTASSASITSFADDLTTMGAGFTVAATPVASNTCSGTLTATPGSTSITMTSGTIPAATSATAAGTCTITVPVQVGNTAPTGNRTNTIAIGGLVTSLGSNIVASTATLSVTSAITLSKSFLPTTVGVNGVTRLTITVTRPVNAALLTSLSVTDPLPPGWAVAPTPNAVTSCTGGTVTAPFGATSIVLGGASLGTSIAAASPCTISVNVQAPGSAGSHTNTIPIGNATATTTVGTVTNIAAATRAISVINGVTLNKSFTPISITPGGVSRLALLIDNSSSTAIALSGISLTDNLPSGLVLRTPPNATVSPQSGTCSGTLNAVGGATSFSMTSGSVSAFGLCELAVDVTTNAIGSFTNTLSPGALTSTEGITSINTASATLISSGSADASITKINGVVSQSAGQSSVYTITVTNASTILAIAGLPVSDPEPAGMTFTNWTCSPSSGSSCLAASGTGPIATSVTLAPLGTATFSVDALLAASATGANITNTVTIDPGASGVIDPDSGNNSAFDTDTILRSANLSVTKTPSNPTPRPGEALTFTVTAANVGPSDAVNVIVNDVLQSGYNFVSATPSVGSWTAPDWTIGTLASGASANLDVAVTVNASGTFSNDATISSTTPDPVSANNTVSVTPSVHNLTTVKTSTILSDPVNGTINPKAIPGAIVEYTITLTNSGPSPIDTNTIVISDVMPAEVETYVSTSGGPPVVFVDGPPATGLGYSYPVNVSWTDQPGGTGPFIYTPVPDGTGFDGAVTAIRIAPNGPMPAPSSFSIRIRAKIK